MLNIFFLPCKITTAACLIIEYFSLSNELTSALAWPFETTFLDSRCHSGNSGVQSVLLRIRVPISALAQFEIVPCLQQSTWVPFSGTLPPALSSSSSERGISCTCSKITSRTQAGSPSKNLDYTQLFNFQVRIAKFAKLQVGNSRSRAVEEVLQPRFLPHRRPAAASRRRLPALSHRDGHGNYHGIQAEGGKEQKRKFS